MLSPSSCGEVTLASRRRNHLDGGGMQRRHFDQLALPESWQSPVSVLAHIDLDAFYAQCLTVRYNIDPAAPVGCRQWNALIAINYPARKYGLKRGVSVEEARKLCPGIHLPHVATFKKGENEWKFHSDPNPYDYKVSLDPFRRESRRIFGVFKEHFRLVEKAGIDEGFIDLGPEIHQHFRKTRPELFESQLETIDLTHDDLLRVGSELVNATRMEIYERLHYTCSAGIAPNKLLAKLGSQYKKPFNQTTVYPQEIPTFLANFSITDAWGWGGKHGKEVLRALGINSDDENLDQCAYVRENFTLQDLERKLGDAVKARRVHDLVRGNEKSEVKPRTLTKSLVAVKNFTTGVPIQNELDLHSWLRVFAADLAGRVADIAEDYGSTVAPKTIGVKFHANRALHSRQQPFEGSCVDIDKFREQVYLQSLSVGSNFIPIPCRYLVIELAGFAPLPKERLMFQKTTKERAALKWSKPVVKAAKPTRPFSFGPFAAPREELNTKALPTNSAKADIEPFYEEEPLFIDTNDEDIVCPRCQVSIELKKRQEHEDWHLAKDLQKENYAVTPSSALDSKTSQKRRPSPTKVSPSKVKASKRDPNQQTILHFFKK